MGVDSRRSRVSMPLAESGPRNTLPLLALSTRSSATVGAARKVGLASVRQQRLAVTQAAVHKFLCSAAAAGRLPLFRRRPAASSSDAVPCCRCLLGGCRLVAARLRPLPVCSLDTEHPIAALAATAALPSLEPAWGCAPSELIRRDSFFTGYGQARQCARQQRMTAGVTNSHAQLQLVLAFRQRGAVRGRCELLA